MKPLYSPLVFLATLFFTFAGASSATAQDTGYFNYADKPTTRQLAWYYQLMFHTDSGWTFVDYWMNDRLKVTGRISEDMKQRLGTFTYYDTYGIVIMRRRFVGHGGAVETHYYPDGHVILEGPTLVNQKSGEWNGYFPSGKIRATAFYTDGQIDTVSFFNEDGSPDNSSKIFYQEADYPGGNEAWLQFMVKNLRYPDAAVKREMQGMVTVGFKVSKEGKTSDFTIIRSAGKELDDEAVRVMKNSGDWLPAIYGGTAVETYKSQPVAFRQDNLPPSDEGDYDKTFTKVEIESAFPGGLGAWSRYLSRNLQYPSDASEKRAQGTVIVQFIVDQQGVVSDVQAISGPETQSLRDEAVRLIKKSGKWTPAIQNGRQVRSYKKVPIVFSLGAL